MSIKKILQANFKYLFLLSKFWVIKVKTKKCKKYQNTYIIYEIQFLCTNLIL